MLKKIRRGLALLSFVLVTLLFLDFTGTIHQWFGWMTNIQFLPAVLALNVVTVVVLILLTLLLGRVYCSVICPLGILQDLIARLGLKAKKNRYRYSPAHNVLRYGFLALFVMLLLAGFTSIAALIAPYSAFGRIASSLLAPLYGWGNNLLALWAERSESYAFYQTEVWLRGVPVLVTATVTLVVVGVLAWRGGRTYCNTVCPVGTVLGFFSRFAWLRPVIDTSKCNGCGLCARNCKSACIDPKQHQIDYSRCVACMDCLGKCHQGAIRYIHPTKGNAHPSAATDAQGRRGFLGVSALLASTALLKAQEKKVDGGLAAVSLQSKPERQTPLVPAGAQGQKHFSQHCTACQLCVSVCPNQVLRPSTDLTHFMQPEMSYERGYCRPECTRCSEVCPTDAIRLVDKAEKSSTQIGHAVWVKANCLVLKDHVMCGNCARHCPSGAIQMVPSDPENSHSLRIPVVDEERCIGCGACENLCPARPFSAIYVEGHERHKTI